MGCMRRVNNSYIFDPKGQVVTVSTECFERLVGEGLVLPYFGS